MTRRRTSYRSPLRLAEFVRAEQLFYSMAAAAVLLLAAPAPAQNPAAPLVGLRIEGDRTTPDAGIALTEQRGQRGRLSLPGWTARWDAEAAMLRPALLRPDEELGDVPVQAMLGAGETPLFFRLPEADHAAPGLWFDAGQLAHWPASGPVLTLLPEGRVLLREAPSPTDETPAVRLPGGAEWPIGSVNAPPRDGLPGLVTGPFDATAPLARLWAEGTMAVPVQPPSAPPEAWLARQATWQSGAPVPLAGLQLAADQAALLFPADHDADLEALFGGSPRRVEIHVPVDAETATSLFTIPAGDWFLREGEALDTAAADTPGVRTFLATDRAGLRLWLAEYGAERVGAAAPSSAAIAALLQRDGAWDATELSRDVVRLAPGEADPAATAELAREDAGPLLIFTDAPRSIESGSGRLVVTEARYADASNALQRDAPPEGALDGRTGFDPWLRNFWAAPPDEDARPGESAWLEWRLPGAEPVAAIDLLHAETVGFSPRFSLKGWTLLARGSSAERWRPVAMRAHDAPPPARERIWFTPPVDAAQFRLEVTEPNFDAASETARLGEILVWTQNGG